MSEHEAKIGIALSAGAARGWAHIGVLTALGRLGVPIDVISGCSSGAIVGASFATGRLDALRTVALGLTQAGMLRFFDLSFSGSGIIEGRWLSEKLRQTIGDVSIEDLDIAFGAVACEYGTGREVWFNSGPIVDAVRASIGVPGLLTPVALRRKWLVDGMLVDPLPVTLCRSLGATVVIAVNTGDSLLENRPQIFTTAEDPAPEPATSSWLARLTGAGGSPALPLPSAPKPGYAEVLGDAFLTMQNFITRIRLASDPPDILISPSLGDLGVMEFHRAAQAIEAGECAIEGRREDLRRLVAGAGRTVAEVKAPSG